MASIRERNGKFNVIYSYTNEKGEETKWETMKRKPKQREEKEIEYKKRWDHLSSVNAKHWTSYYRICCTLWQRKTGRFLHEGNVSYQ